MIDEHSTRTDLAGGREALVRRVEHIPAAIVKSAARFAVSRALEPALMHVVDRTLHEALSRAFDAAPEGAVSEELEQKVQDLLHTIVQEILTHALTGPAGTELETHGQQAMEAALRRDGASVQSEASAALSSVVEAVSQVFRNHRKELVGIVGHALSRAAVDGAADKVKEVVQTGGSEPDHSVEEHEEPVAEKGVTDNARQPIHGEDERDHRRNTMGQELRDQLTNAGETLKQQLLAETKEVQQRLRQELGSAAKKSTQNQNLGRAPTGGHPSVRGGARPGPSQGAPGTRRRT